MPVALKTTVTELPESRVRVQVQVPPSEIEARVEHKARQLGREMRLPGDRERIRQYGAISALDLLRRALIGLEA